eukprot:UN03251
MNGFPQMGQYWSNWLQLEIILPTTHILPTDYRNIRIYVVPDNYEYPDFVLTQWINFETVETAPTEPTSFNSYTLHSHGLLVSSFALGLSSTTLGTVGTNPVIRARFRFQVSSHLLAQQRRIDGNIDPKSLASALFKRIHIVTDSSGTSPVDEMMRFVTLTHEDYNRAATVNPNWLLDDAVALPSTSTLATLKLAPPILTNLILPSTITNTQMDFKIQYTNSATIRAEHAIWVVLTKPTTTTTNVNAQALFKWAGFNGNNAQTSLTLTDVGVAGTYGANWPIDIQIQCATVTYEQTPFSYTGQVVANNVALILKCTFNIDTMRTALKAAATAAGRGESTVNTLEPVYIGKFAFEFDFTRTYNSENVNERRITQNVSFFTSHPHFVQGATMTPQDPNPNNPPYLYYSTLPVGGDVSKQTSYLTLGWSNNEYPVVANARIYTTTTGITGPTTAVHTFQLPQNIPTTTTYPIYGYAQDFIANLDIRLFTEFFDLSIYKTNVEEFTIKLISTTNTGTGTPTTLKTTTYQLSAGFKQTDMTQENQMPNKPEYTFVDYYDQVLYFELSFIIKAGSGGITLPTYRTTGFKFSRPVACLDKCKNGGICNHVTQQCECADGYSGLTCDTSWCDLYCDEDNTASCDLAKRECTCDLTKGFVGPYCDISAECPLSGRKERCYNRG